MKYQFTNDWFAGVPDIWGQLKPLLPEVTSALEIGSYEGQSMVWLVENWLTPTGTLICVDTWEGGEEHAETDMSAVQARFMHNRYRVEMVHPKAEVLMRKGRSSRVLAQLAVAGQAFDFIYVDGSHQAKDVLTDACMAWPLLRPGGLMVFDDYLWGSPRDLLHRPKVAIDAFSNMFAEELQPVYVGRQYVVRKLEG